jgi:hypothetical protein
LLIGCRCQSVGRHLFRLRCADFQHHKKDSACVNPSGNLPKDAFAVRSGVAAGLRYHAMDKVYPGCGILPGFSHHHALHANFPDIPTAPGSPRLFKVRALGTMKSSWMDEVWKKD